MSADNLFDPRLQAYLDDELSLAERVQLESQLAVDTRLADDLARLRVVNTLARRSLVPEMPAALADRIRQSVAGERPRTAWWEFLVPGHGRPATALAWGLSSTTLLVCLGLLSVSVTQESKDAASTVSAVAPSAALPPTAAAPPRAMGAADRPVPVSPSTFEVGPAPKAATPTAPGGTGVAAKRIGVDAKSTPPRPGEAGGVRMVEPLRSGVAADKPGDSAAITRQSVGVEAFRRPDVPPTRQETALSAGEVDDNQLFGKYLDYLRHAVPVREAPWVDVRERYVLQVVDADGRGVPDAELVINQFERPQPFFSGRTDSSGQAVCFAGSASQLPPKAMLGARVNGSSKWVNTTFVRKPEGGTYQLKLPDAGQRTQGLALDVAFVVDTTGSMGEEIGRVRDTIDDVAARIAQLPGQPKLRLGLVLYRDRQDVYVTKAHPFTSSVDTFRSYLQDVTADGGGDAPEDVNAALRTTVSELQWAPEPALRLAFLVGDAPPHLNYQGEEQYLPVTQDAVKRGLKVFAVSTSGDSGGPDDDLREYVWRQVALFTRGRFLFITKGGAGADAGSTPHHVDRQDYTVAKLPDLVVTCVSRELAALGKPPVAPPAADLGEPLHEPGNRPSQGAMVAPEPPRSPAPRVEYRLEVRHELPWRTLLVVLLVLANVLGWAYAWNRSRLPLVTQRPMPEDWRWRPPRHDDTSS